MGLQIKAYSPDKVRYSIDDLTIEEILSIYDSLQLSLEIMDLKMKYAKQAAKDDISFIELHQKLSKKYVTARAKVHNAFTNPKEVT